MGPAADASLGNLPDGHAHIFLQVYILVLQGNTYKANPLHKLHRTTFNRGELLTNFLTSMQEGKFLNDRAAMRGPPLTTTQGTY